MATVKGSKFAKALWPGVKAAFDSAYLAEDDDMSSTDERVIAVSKSTLIESDRDIASQRRKARLKVSEVERVATYIVDAMNDPDMELTDIDYEHINKILLNISDEATKVKQRCRPRAGTAYFATTHLQDAHTYGKSADQSPSKREIADMTAYAESEQHHILQREWAEMFLEHEKKWGRS